VPADAAGTRLRRFHYAAADCDRAELCVHTNTTRGARSTPSGTNPANAPGRNRR